MEVGNSLLSKYGILTYLSMAAPEKTSERHTQTQRTDCRLLQGRGVWGWGEQGEGAGEYKLVVTKTVTGT